MEAAIKKTITMKKFLTALGCSQWCKLCSRCSFFCDLANSLHDILVVEIRVGNFDLMYKVAGGLQSPFVSDLNELDFVFIGNKIVREVIIVFHQQRAGCKAQLHEPNGTPQYSVDKYILEYAIEARTVTLFWEYDSLSDWDRFIY